MKNFLLFLTAALFTLGNIRAQTNPNAILRIWETEEKDGRIQMLKTGNTYCAQMIWGKQLLEADGKTYKKDINNPDPALRSRSLNNYTLISGLVYEDGKWVDGKIYNFSDGNSYDVKIELRDGLLYMRVYKGITIFGKTLKWHPVP